MHHSAAARHAIGDGAGARSCSPRFDGFCGACETALRSTLEPEHRFSLFTDAHPDSELLGTGLPGSLPWALITGVAPDRMTRLHDRPVLAVLAETALEVAHRRSSSTGGRLLQRAHLGDARRLRRSSIRTPCGRHGRRPHRASRRGPALRDDRVNGPDLLRLRAACAPWGAFPGHQVDDIRSGRGVVHNSYLLARTEKTVFRGPFHITPKPAWWPTHGHANEVFARLADFEAAPSPAKMSAIVSHAMRG